MGKLGSLLNTTVGFTVEAASALSHSSQPASTSGSHSYAASPSPYLRSQNPSQFQQTNMQQGLPLPVIIPQRRPQNKSRGWARAYAPALMGAGIDEATFLGFVDRFNEESKASPYLHVVNVAGAGVGFIPGITPMLISMAVPIAVSAAKKAQSTHQTESYLDKANKALFVPRGLYAIVMTYDPQNTSDTVDVNMSANSSQAQPPYRSPSPYSNHSLKTPQQPAFTLPDSCRLVFADAAPPQTLDPNRNGFLKFGDFVSDFKDRRAQASFAQENPDSTLIGPKPMFKSKYADPSYGSNGGSGAAKVPVEAVQKPGRIKAMKEKIMHSDVLYLMIVNNTTDGAESAMLEEGTVRPFDLTKQHDSAQAYQPQEPYRRNDGYASSNEKQQQYSSGRQFGTSQNGQQRQPGEGVLDTQWQGSYERRFARPPLPPRNGAPPPRYEPYERDEYRESGGEGFCVPTL